MKIDKDIEIIFEEIIKMIYQQAKSTQTVVNILKEKYDLQNSRAYMIVREAKVYFSEWINDTKGDTLNECIQILEMAREKALEVDDLKEVRECTKEIAKLEQLYIEKIEHTVKSEQPLWNLGEGGKEGE